MKTLQEILFMVGMANLCLAVLVFIVYEVARITIAGTHTPSPTAAVLCGLFFLGSIAASLLDKK